MRTVKDIVYVGLQALLLLIFLADNENWKFEVPQLIKIISVAFGLLGALVTFISLLQLGGSLSPFPSPKTNGKLIRSGIYHYIRHPIYTGIILAAFSLGIFLGSGWKLGVSILLTVLFFRKSKYEEKQLAQKFPDYRQYCQSTGRFLPKIQNLRL
jgi:protein-S-isoprenylcysteine O-methyltransferase Ste14